MDIVEIMVDIAVIMMVDCDDHGYSNGGDHGE